MSCLRTQVSALLTAGMSQGNLLAVCWRLPLCSCGWPTGSGVKSAGMLSRLGVRGAPSQLGPGPASTGCLYWPVRNSGSVASQPMRKLQSQSGNKGSSSWQVRGGFQGQGWPAAQAVGRWQAGNRCAAHGPCRKPGRAKKGRPCLQPEFEELLSSGATPSAVRRALEGL